ncbi:MAG: nickel-dependent lactate racemase [Clostridia bacterium]|nr:nickel-dependent lactate racemase [Clostridia bacterium]
MAEVSFLYGSGCIKTEIADERLLAVLEPKAAAPSDKTEAELVAGAMRAPRGSKPLSELANGKKKIVLIASDHTRPVPSRLIVPSMLREIRKGNPDADVTILIATGCHRGTTEAELRAKFGDAIVESEKIVVHDCEDEDNLVEIGTLPSGAALRINRIAAEADLLVAEGFVEPHFFAGFSGGRKSVLPGICARRTVMANHCSKFIDSPFARTGILDGNPIHRDMLAAARMAKLAFVCNVVLDADKKVIFAAAGDPDDAQRAGADFLLGRSMVKPAMADIVISTNGGYPLDQNIYQAVKGMTAAEATVREGGVIIMCAKSGDGHGGERFWKTFRDEKDVGKLLAAFRATAPEDTIPDQWQSQIFARVLSRATVIYLSEAPDELVRDLHMIPVHSLEEAIAEADRILGCKGTITAIPDGVGVIVRE